MHPHSIGGILTILGRKPQYLRLVGHVTTIVSFDFLIHKGCKKTAEDIKVVGGLFMVTSVVYTLVVAA